jgi:hypothetical protein
MQLCAKRFDDVTGTIFSGRHQSITVWISYLSTSFGTITAWKPKAQYFLNLRAFAVDF